MYQKIDISVVILLEEESPDFAQYTEILYKFFQQRGSAFEFIIIANGVEWFLKSQVNQLFNGFNNIKAFSFPNRVSQAVCVRAALKESQAEIIVMCGSKPSSLRTLHSLIMRSMVVPLLSRSRVA